ncbi:MAG: RdgB/HAM1 family non-canonical purine NTP pyrophosphatase [Bacteroidales bacterium]|nr:RdgB/HAM1 family non-canonical purine NTP pyrophosphatase [Bacteroidales bacterium]MBD5352256.1 RdgB/HAM1 family non-canonical purine NTP pyrophosphatase [Bacteroides sp.]MBD5361131.1 RdgB/HAM1 family non-canonical purine NTP pyrophosphatase [Bacteroides sp.]MBD5364342.1 RdgB/HAM1 family non-canonical purine NTP pyrophosphatase [Bacteroides sp.]MDE6263489.1 RdgB/HAM1 family non-canonical purine NTP pyrophosphatase [Muribaculaceae bacterium]
MLVFATNNDHKLREVRQMLPAEIEVKSLNDIGLHDDIPETALTLEGNAELKARYVSERFGGCDVFADDTGLEVEALNGAPGVFSARYAGPGHDSAANMARLLREMEGKDNRRARFRTVIALIRNGQLQTVEGIVNGTIALAPQGTDGFGYDPVFIPDETPGRSFAQMTPDEKNAISHRGRAMQALKRILSI